MVPLVGILESQSGVSAVIYSLLRKSRVTLREECINLYQKDPAHVIEKKSKRDYRDARHDETDRRAFYEYDKKGKKFKVKYSEGLKKNKLLTKSCYHSTYILKLLKKEFR